MNNLLDNEQIEDIKDITEMAAQTFDTIKNNNTPFGLIVESAACRAGPGFFRAMSEELQEYSTALAGLASTTADSIESIINKET